MNELNFINLDDIGIYNVRFKCFEVSDGYQATFYVRNKSNSEIYYKINFQISGTEYNTDITNLGKSTNVYIQENYSNLESCFKEIGMRYLQKKISLCDLKDEDVSLIKYLF
ncbi:MAG: hypothetical protein V1667_03425 [bacterium]